MRSFILLIALALLPVLVILHGWLHTEKQLPDLRCQVLAALESQGIHHPVAELTYLDLSIAGDAPDPQALEKARAAVLAIKPLRLVNNELRIPPSLRANLAKDTLTLEGWLPEEQNIHEATQIILKQRPDLTVNTDALQSHPHVRWPEGENGPLTTTSRLLAPVLESLKVPAWLEITQSPSGVKLSGLVPAKDLRGNLIKLLKNPNATDLAESPHTLPSILSEAEALTAFVRAFFSAPSPRRFTISKEGEPTLEAPATRTLESKWLSLLRPLTDEKQIISKLVFYPSEYHFPSYKTVSPISETHRQILAATLSEQLIIFAPGSQALTTQEQAKLAALTPSLLTAGPALKLVIGGHPDPAGDPEAERRLALARAEAVHSFLVEQGLPASDVQTAAFDPVPAGTSGAPETIPSVEILIR